LIRRTADENKRDFTQRLLNYFVRDFEEKVRQYPKQWFNYYNFWN
jgi:predicted LPLAT superfamily acyltransferase